MSSYNPISELQTLPQFSFINPDRFQPWIDRVNAIDPGRLPWHVRRLSGFGGSEIGVLVGALRGYYHPHQSANQLVAMKLLNVLPEPPNGDLLRGQEMEEFARAKYRQQILLRYPNAKPRDDIIEHLGKFRDPKYPWLIGTPDEVIEVEPGKIWIVDYKCPNPTALEEYKNSGVPFYYSAQLHHYRYIAEQMGYEISGLELASLDYKEWNMFCQEVPYSKNLEEQCLYAGDYYWNQFVMKGVVPPKDGVKRYGDIADLHNNLREGAVLYTLYASVSNYLAKQKDRIHDLIKQSGASLDTSVDNISVGLVNILANREYDLTAFDQELQKQSIPRVLYEDSGEYDSSKMLNFIMNHFDVKDPNHVVLQQFKTSPTLNPKLMLEQARKIGLDIAPFIISEEIKLQLARSQDLYSEHMRKELQTIVKVAAKDFVEQIREQLLTAEINYSAAKPNAKKPRR